MRFEREFQPPDPAFVGYFEDDGGISVMDRKSVLPALEKLTWRGTALLWKATGRYPGISWKYILAHILPASSRRRAMPSDLVRMVSESELIESFATPWGHFCLPKPGGAVLSWLLHDIFVDAEYENGDIVVNEGDVVIDCGAHVGVFARFALERRASRVVCIEMDDLNAVCLRENLCGNEHRTLTLHAALWSRSTTLKFFPSQYSDCHRVAESGPSAATKDGKPLDELLIGADLSRVDFLKIDVEGAEPEVLKGALETITRFRPKLALAVYHNRTEESRVREVFQKAAVNYQFSYRRLKGPNAYILFGKAAG